MDHSFFPSLLQISASYHSYESIMWDNYTSHLWQWKKTCPRLDPQNTEKSMQEILQTTRSVLLIQDGQFPIYHNAGIYLPAHTNYIITATWHRCIESYFSKACTGHPRSVITTDVFACSRSMVPYIYLVNVISGFKKTFHLHYRLVSWQKLSLKLANLANCCQFCKYNNNGSRDTVLACSSRTWWVVVFLPRVPGLFWGFLLMSIFE